MTRINFEQKCQHVPSHPNWNTRGRIIGVCMMTNQHLDSTIKMLTNSLRVLRAANPTRYENLPDYQETLVKLETMNKERARRRSVAKETAFFDSYKARPNDLRRYTR